MRAYGLIGVLLFGAAWSPAVARETYYADTCVEQESGDTAGYVVIISDGKPLPSISLSWSEGALMLPVKAEVADYDRNSGHLAFSVHSDSGEFRFEGKLGPHTLEGTLNEPFQDPQKPPQEIKLKEQPRKAAFEPHAECR